MNIAVIGTGMVGRLIAVELSREHQVYAIDNNSENLNLLKKYNPKIISNKNIYYFIKVGNINNILINNTLNL